MCSVEPLLSNELCVTQTQRFSCVYKAQWKTWECLSQSQPTSCPISHINTLQQDLLFGRKNLMCQWLSLIQNVSPPPRLMSKHIKILSEAEGLESVAGWGCTIQKSGHRPPHTLTQDSGTFKRARVLPPDLLTNLCNKPLYHRRLPVSVVLEGAPRCYNAVCDVRGYAHMHLKTTT